MADSLTTVDMVHHMEIAKIESFLNVYLMFSGNEFYMCTPGDLMLVFPNFIVFREWT